MSAMMSLSHLIGIYTRSLSKQESTYFEAELFIRVYEELMEVYKSQYKNYFNLIRLSMEKENTMIEVNFIRLMINDILATDEYTLAGIAYYTETTEEVVYEAVMGCNTRPSAVFLRKVIQLHREVKPEIYQRIKAKIIAEYLNAA